MLISWKTLFLLLFYLFFLLIFYWQVVRSVVAVTRTSAAGHPLHHAVSFHFCAISYHFFQGFLFFDFFMIMCFSLFLFGVLLYPFFSLVFTSFCHLFVFPTFLSSLFLIKKSLLVLSLLFRSALVLTFFKRALLFFNFSFFPKTCHSFLCTFFPYSLILFLILFFCFSFWSLVCSLFFVVYIFFLNISFFSSLRCPFFSKKKSVLISFRLFFNRNMITIVSILLSFFKITPLFSFFLVHVFCCSP